MKKHNINEGISCNVRNCVYNERGCDCNLERVSISRGNGGNHYCKSYVSLSDNFNLEKQESFINVEASGEYFDFKDLVNNLENTDKDK